MAELEGFEIGDPVAELYERNLTSSSAESKHVTAVLEAVADILRQEGIKPSPTAVFAASLSSLERANTEASPEMSAAMLTVLGVALEHAPTGPVLSRLPHAMQVLLATGRAAQEKPVALRGVVRCIGQLVAALRDAQDPGTNEWPHCAKAFGAISNLCVDSRPKVRKQAAASVAEALRAVRGTSAAGPASRTFANVAVSIARAPVKAARELTSMHGASGAKAAEQRAQAAAQESLHLLVALKLILGELDGSAAGEVAGAVTGLLDLAEPLLTQHACDALVALFQPTGASATAAAAAAAAAAAGNAALGSRTRRRATGPRMELEPGRRDGRGGDRSPFHRRAERVHAPTHPRRVPHPRPRRRRSPAARARPGGGWSPRAAPSVPRTGEDAERGARGGGDGGGHLPRIPRHQVR